MTKVVYSRDVFPDIMEGIEKSTIVIHGARQVGKTTLMRLIVDNLIETKNVPLKQICFMDLEDPQLLQVCNAGYKSVIEYIEATGSDLSDKTFLLIDEIQYLDNPSSLIKLLTDHTSIHLMVSGSSSFEIKSKFKDSLVGRTLNFELFGLSFVEFLKFKNENIELEKINKNTPPAIHNRLKELFKEYCIYGSYPKIVLEKDITFKKKYVQQIIDTYVKKDIADIARVKDVRKFNSLLKILAQQTGGLININEMSRILGLSRETIEKYLFILEHTYVIKLVYPYSKNSKIEISKMPKIYFEDTGLMNIIAGFEFPNELNGHLFENGIYCHLRKLFKYLNYWRLKNGQEVDFIIKHKENMVPIEVKLHATAKLSSTRSFIKKYKVENGYQMGLSLFKQSESGRVIPIYPWQIYQFNIKN